MLVDILLDASDYGDLVLDCFGGSGSTLMAAQQCGRRARIIEISPEYCDVIIYRWEELTKQKHIILNREVKNPLFHHTSEFYVHFVIANYGKMAAEMATQDIAVVIKIVTILKRLIRIKKIKMLTTFLIIYTNFLTY